MLLSIIGLASLIPALSGFKYIYLAFPIGLSLALIDLFKKQSTIIGKIAIPTLFDNIIPKLILPLVFILVFTQFF
jgi:hypothetical protein